MRRGRYGRKGCGKEGMDERSSGGEAVGGLVMQVVRAESDAKEAGGDACEQRRDCGIDERRCGQRRVRMRKRRREMRQGARESERRISKLSARRQGNAEGG